MAAGDSSDLLMKFVLDSGPLPGESTTDIGGREGSRLLKGFQPGSIIEIDSFKFSVGVEDNSPGAKKKVDPKTGLADKKSTSGQFSAWRNGTPHKKYPVTVQPISFTRGIDRTSTLFLHHCIKSTSFKSATIVKRKAAGGKAAGEVYLRLDFVGVLIIQAGWSNDDPVKETCQFIARAITVNYRPQLPDGTLGDTRHGFWSMLPWEHEVVL